MMASHTYKNDCLVIMRCNFGGQVKSAFLLARQFTTEHRIWQHLMTFQTLTNTFHATGESG